MPAGSLYATIVSTIDLDTSYERIEATKRYFGRVVPHGLIVEEDVSRIRWRLDGCFWIREKSLGLCGSRVCYEFNSSDTQVD
jgi:hypothetical protein